MDYLLILGGLVLLAIGGELLVRGAVQLAERMGVSPLLIGLTLVGFGTSAPELVTSVQGASSFPSSGSSSRWRSCRFHGGGGRKSRTARALPGPAGC